MGSVPVALALVAGGLATLNPCGFPLLPAFLTFYVGADAEQLPRAPTRVAQGLLVGLLVTAGFLGLFGVVGLPLIYGATAVARAVPWAGIAIGLVLVAAGLVTLTGRRLALPLSRPVAPGSERRARTMVLFGVAYGVASLGCTLPVFLTLLGASLGAGGTAASLAVFAAYGVGMGLVLMALSVAAALLQQGLARRLRRLLPHLPRVTGALLVLAGTYLTYYWLRIRFGPRATLSSDPLVGRVTRFTAQLQAFAEERASVVLVVAALMVVIGVAAAGWQARLQAARRPTAVSPTEGAPHDH
jgi:cytochrome c biogenesis protein CcdA